MYGLNDPVDSRVSTDLITREPRDIHDDPNTYHFVVGVDEYNFIILVHTILVDPIRVQHSQIATATADALFCNTS